MCVCAQSLCVCVCVHVCIALTFFFPCLIEVPNGEVADLEMPGKSSLEEGEQQEHKRPQFPAGESLMVETSQLDMENMMDPGLGGLSNDEAAMAVIMSLLETDADLGEAVVMDEINWSL